FQERLNARLLAASKESRDRRLKWISTPPEQIPALVEHATVAIEVPADPARARELLSELYDTGQDFAISAAFLKFAAVLGDLPGAMDLAYMAEINLGVNGLPCDLERIRKSIDILRDAIGRGDAHTGSLLYCQGNARLALREHAEAIESYRTA